MPTLGTAMATYCGQNLGAGKHDRIFRGMKDAFYLCFFACLLYTSYDKDGKLIPQLASDMPEVSDDETVYTVKMIKSQDVYKRQGCG